MYPNPLADGKASLDPLRATSFSSVQSWPQVRLHRPLPYLTVCSEGREFGDIIWQVACGGTALSVLATRLHTTGQDNGTRLCTLTR